MKIYSPRGTYNARQVSRVRPLDFLSSYLSFQFHTRITAGIVAFLFAGTLMHCSAFDSAPFLTKNAISSTRGGTFVKLSSLKAPSLISP